MLSTSPRDSTLLTASWGKWCYLASGEGLRHSMGTEPSQGSPYPCLPVEKL